MKRITLVEEERQINQHFDSNSLYGKVSLFVSSTDNNYWIWPIFFKFLSEYWTECNLPTFLSTEDKEFRSDKILTLNSHERNWSDCVICNLKKLKSKYIIFMLDDFVLNRRIENQTLRYLLNEVDSRTMLSLRLNDRTLKPYTNSSSISGLKFLRIPSVKEKFRVSLNATIWNREFFLSLLESSETPWQFEDLGSKRSLKYDQGFYACNKAIINYEFGGILHHGKMFKYHSNEYKKEGFFVPKQVIMTKREEIAYILENIYNRIPFSDILLSIPKKYIRKILLNK